MATVLKPDPFNAVLLDSPSLEVTLEQQNIIKKVLELACSDSRFAQKAYDAIWHVLTVGNARVPEITSLSPDTAAIGSAPFNMTVGGKEFTETSQVLFNGAPITAGLVGNNLIARVNVSGYLNPGQVSVGVLDNGVLSNLMQFTLTASRREGEKDTEPSGKDKILESKKASEVLDRK